MTITNSVSKHPAVTQLEAMWRQGYRAKDLNAWLEANGYPMLDRKNLGRYGQRYWNDGELVSPMLLEVEGDEDIDAQLDEAKALLDQVQAKGLGTVKKIVVGSKSYPSWQRDEGAEFAHTIEAQSKVRTIEILPNALGGAALVERATLPPINVTVPKSSGRKPDGWKVGVFLPDMQIGYFSDSKEAFTTHDEAAIDVAHQIMGSVQAEYGIDMVVNAGDNLDFPALSSKHRSAPGFWQTTQAGIDRAAAEGATQRALAPDADIFWLQGNHEARMTNFLIDNAPAVSGLTRAGEEQPVMSVPYLCRFDESNITFIDGYPDGEVWVNDHLRFEHGSLHSSGKGATSAKQLANGISVGFGHIHRAELLYQTRNTKKGPRTHFAGSPGCLCRIDGTVPSSKTGITAKGSQTKHKAEDWQQGLWVFWYQETGDQLTAIEPVAIWSGWAMYRGQPFTATVTPDGTAI